MAVIVARPSGSLPAPLVGIEATVNALAVLEEGKPLYPTAVTVAVFDPIGSVVFEGTAQIMKNEVSFTIPENVATESGEYTVVFKVRLFNLGIRTHTMKVEVLPLPTTEEEGTTDETMEVAGEEQDSLAESWDIKDWK